MKTGMPNALPRMDVARFRRFAEAWSARLIELERGFGANFCTACERMRDSIVPNCRNKDHAYRAGFRVAIALVEFALHEEAEANAAGATKESTS